MIAAVATVFSVLAFWLFVLAPRGSEIEALKGEILSAGADLDSLDAQLATLQGIDPQALQAELAGYRTQIPPTADERGIIQALLDASRTAGVSFDGLQFNNGGASSLGPVSVINVSFNANGAYFDLARFLFELEHLDRLAYVRTMSVSPGQAGLTLALSVDMFTTDTSVGPGSDPAPGAEVGA